MNKETIQSALIHFKDKSLLDGSLAVLHSLGYKSDSDFSVDDSSFKGIQKLIKEQLQKELNPEKCISKDWLFRPARLRRADESRARLLLGR